MTQHEDYVDYPTSVLLKESGFDWPTHGYYHKGNCADDEVWYFTMNPADDHNHRNNPRVWSAPTLAQTQKWLREVKDCIIVVYPSVDFYDCNDVVIPFLDGKWFFELWVKAERINPKETASVDIPTYEAALSAGITAALEMITDKIKRP